MAKTNRRDRRLEELTDRIEDRLRDAPIGLHQTGEAASDQAVADLPDEAAALWRRWDGMALGNGEFRLLSLAEQDEATHEANETGILRDGDRVIGEVGLALLVLPADPWAEGGDVVMVEEDGERSPYASSLIRLVIGMLAEMTLLYDDDGEYRDDLFDEFGELMPKAERRLLRRRLDFDEDAPFPRFRLGQLLRRGGEARAARSELRRVIHCAPEFAWAHWELGRAELDVAETAGDEQPERCRANAAEAFAAAAEKAGDAGLQALFLAWQARASDGDERARLAARVLELDPGFVSTREHAVREALEHEDREQARELLELGLAVEPRHLGLLGLRGAVVEPDDSRG
jgi:hypothetical protein